MSRPTKDDALRHLEQELGTLVRRVRRIIRERAAAVHPDLQSTSYLVLGYLLREGPVRASALSAVFDMDKAATSRQVQHLLDLGLVERAADPADGRATLISATDDGVRRLGDVSAHRRRLLAERLGDWSAADLERFASMLARYNAALTESDD